ncbi:DUF1003 domain-containing protein [Kitasatospora sp. NPDC094011]|uniref:DUF1003 domain-containing protein n=1 Tax=Kitasatospora sp. NPDC094011 TaxID=3364090 RepID=UPI00382B072E
MPDGALGQRAADRVAAAFGSWTFIWSQTLFIAAWMIANSVAEVPHWDEYPFGLLNLVFSVQAAYAAPLILLSQNRSTDRDRQRAEQDLSADTETLGIVRAMADHLGVSR